MCVAIRRLDDAHHLAISLPPTLSSPWVRPRGLVWLAGSWPLPDVARAPATGQSADAVPLADLVTTAGSNALRKRHFVAYVLPLIDAANAAILTERTGVLRLRSKVAAGLPLSRTERRWLHAIEIGYGLATDDFAELLRRVDIVPPSLALAQAALESAWGTSRFAREGNALFGQRAWGAGAGLVPLDRSRGDLHVVRAFGAMGAASSPTCAT